MELNRKTYHSKAIIRWYEQLRGLVPVEQQIFEQYAEFISQTSLLDIGVGGGRTTAYLLGRCKSYTAIDYSEGFVKHTKALFPAADCHVMDARDLSAFKDSSFGFVNFSFNGMDYVGPEDREKILREIARVLQPDGIFFLSTHNKAHATFNQQPWLNSTDPFLIRLKTFLKLLPFLYRKRKHRKAERFEKEFALVNDSAHNYQLMTFYTSPAFLRGQLQNVGLQPLAFYGYSGEKKEDQQLDHWIFATAKKLRP